jgi:hypothetical protein
MKNITIKIMAVLLIPLFAALGLFGAAYDWATGVPEEKRKWVIIFTPR